MKVKKSEAVALLKGLGFGKAGEWEDDKILGRLGQVPGHVKAEDVPKEHVALYEELGKNEGQIELVNDDAKDEAPEPKQKRTAVDRAVDKAAKTKKEEDMKKNKSKDAKKGGKEKPAKEKKAKKEVEVDAYGATVGSIRAKVNAQFSKDWTSLDDIAKAAGVKTRQARIRLRRAVKAGILEKQTRVEYRLAANKKKG